MEDFFDIFMNSPLFAGIGEGDLAAMLACLDARTASYPKGSAVFLAGDPARRVGLVLEGSVQVVRDDVFGNQSVLAKLGPGELFGEVFACAGTETLPVSALAVAGSTVLLMDYRRIVTTCPTGCAFHGRLIENMLGILAGKNLLLSAKIEALSARSIREKLLVYLGAQASRAGGREFSIPFSRQELADYLAVDRSALSREMAAMGKEGLIRYHKNRFELPE